MRDLVAQIDVDTVLMPLHGLVPTVWDWPQINSIIKSIEQQGLRYPLACNQPRPDGCPDLHMMVPWLHINTGCQRWAAAMRMGYERISCLVFENRKHAMRHNTVRLMRADSNWSKELAQESRKPNMP